MGLCPNSNLAYLFVVMRQDDLCSLRRECRATQPSRPFARSRRIIGVPLMAVGRRLFKIFL